MTQMISYCCACSAQNFVSAERKAVRNPAPRCWNCGAALPAEDETAPGGRESNGMAGTVKTSGSGENG